MIISPPFLLPNPSDAQDLLNKGLQPVHARHATTGAPEGNFPVSQNLTWHTGLHVKAPPQHNGHHPVRAIAGGNIVFIQKPSAEVKDRSHGQTYNAFGPEVSWTDNGMIVIAHTTDIGASGNTATSVTFYSSYMHLSTIEATHQVGQAIRRKDILGQPGQIYGHSGQLELGICCDAANLQTIIGRVPLWTDPKSAPTDNGRTDSVFGKVYIYLPDTTPIRAKPPTHHLRGSIHSPGPLLGKPLWVSLDYHVAPGSCTITSYHVNGQILHQREDKDAEYDLFNEANKRHASLRKYDVTDSTPSGWYELLRFGRNLGTDPLPREAVHWRKIMTPDGKEYWADLNTPSSYQFSDADFLPQFGWNCFGDDAKVDDQRCDSVDLKCLIRDPTNPESILDRTKLAKRIGHKDVLPKLARTICKFPFEWDQDGILKRYAFIQKEFQLTDENWEKVKHHLIAMSVANLPDAFRQAQWHFHPGEFIRHFRNCGWLSEEEVVRVVRETVFDKNGKESAPILRTDIKTRLRSAADKRPANLSPALQRAMRKYGITQTHRIAHLFGQLAAETARLTYMVELGKDSYFDMYEPVANKTNKLGNTLKGDGKRFKGRGLLQLTGRENYTHYGKYKGRFYLLDEDVELLTTDANLTCDASGFFWVSKQRYRYGAKNEYVLYGKAGISYWADLGVTEEATFQVTKCVNPGGKHFKDIRWPCFEHAWYVLNDAVTPSMNFKPVSSESNKK
ncbi:hypothetical protein ACVBEF_00725 [Glaciimonas sp. GG7]